MRNKFPISNNTATENLVSVFLQSAKITGVERKTAKMMRLDLEAARKKWMDEVNSASKMKRREKSDFLKYRDSNGLFADFHGNRHTFISNLTLAGVSPKLAQTWARHSDSNLTMQIYTRTSGRTNARRRFRRCHCHRSTQRKENNHWPTASRSLFRATVRC